MNYVYQFVDGKEVLYIGKSDRSDFRRIREHGTIQDNIPKEAHEKIRRADVYIIFLCNSTMSDVVESELIRRYRPPYNKAKQSEWAGLDFPELKWIPYRIDGKIVYKINDQTFSNSEMGIEKYDYYKGYLECVEKIKNQQHELDCLKQKNTTSESNESLKRELQILKECLESNRKDRDYWVDSSHKWYKLYNEQFEKWYNESQICLSFMKKYSDLSESHDDLVTKWNDLVKKYNTVLAENKKLNEQQSSKKTISIWEKLFSKRKSA